MISFFGSKWERFFFGIPLKVSLHYDNTSVLDNINKHLLFHQFFNPTINDHIVLSFVTPGHILKFSALLLLHIFFSNVLFSFLLKVKAVGFDDRNISCWTDIMGRGMLLSICTFLCSSYLHESHKWQSLENSSAHVFNIMMKYISWWFSG